MFRKNIYKLCAMFLVFIGCESQKSQNSDLGQMIDINDFTIDSTMDISVNEQSMIDEMKWSEREYQQIDDEWPLNALQVLATHNSYHIQPRPDALAEWRYTHPSLTEQLALGVRQIELDLHAHPNGFYEVYHLPVIDEVTQCQLFLDCLQEIHDWSERNPFHLPLIILIEFKDVIDPYKITRQKEIDQLMLSIWPRTSLITPDDIRNPPHTLRQSLLQSGWPSIGSLRGKVMFVLLSGGVHRDAYVDGDENLSDRVMFIRGDAERAYGSIVEWGDLRGHEDAIEQAYHHNYLIRVKGDDTDQDEVQQTQQRESTLANPHAHWLNSDFVNQAQRQEVWGDALQVLPRCVPAFCQDMQ